MNQEALEILECLVDELEASEFHPSERTIMILAKYEDDFDFVKDYFNKLEERQNKY